MSATIVVVGAAASPSYGFKPGKVLKDDVLAAVSPNEAIEVIYAVDRPQTSGDAPQDHEKWVPLADVNMFVPRTINSSGAPCSQKFQTIVGDDVGIYAINARFSSNEADINGTVIPLDPCFDGWSRIMVVVSFIRQFADGQLQEENVISSALPRAVPLLVSTVGPEGTRSQTRVSPRDSVLFRKFGGSEF
jgi:hypothetical protein